MILISNFVTDTQAILFKKKRSTLAVASFESLTMSNVCRKIL